MGWKLMKEMKKIKKPAFTSDFWNKLRLEWDGTGNKLMYFSYSISSKYPSIKVLDNCPVSFINSELCMATSSGDLDATNRPYRHF